MQGMIAEYERSKIMERHRRGKIHAAKRGSVNVLANAHMVIVILINMPGE